MKKGIDAATIRTYQCSLERFDQQWRSERGWKPLSADEEVVAVDLDDLERVHPPESPDERLQRVERVMLDYTAQWLQLTGRAEPPVPVDVELSSADRDALRELHKQLSRMASVDRVAGPFRGTRPHVDGDLPAMVRALDKLLAPVGVDEPLPCSGCGGAESVCNCKCGYHPCGCKCHQTGARR